MPTPRNYNFIFTFLLFSFAFRLFIVTFANNIVNKQLKNKCK